MPIRESQKARYPADWSTVVVPRIRARSGGRCECRGDCGRDHDEETLHANTDEGTLIVVVSTEIGGPGYEEARCEAINGRPHPITGSVVVLTVAHLNHQPEDCTDANLLHMCQRCHLTYDAVHHAETRAASRAAELAAQMHPLFEIETSTETTS